MFCNCDYTVGPIIHIQNLRNYEKFMFTATWVMYFNYCSAKVFASSTHSAK